LRKPNFEGLANIQQFWIVLAGIGLALTSAICQNATENNVLQAVNAQKMVPDFVVSTDGGLYYARSPAKGTIMMNSSFSSLMSTINANLSSGGLIYITAGTYDIDSPITISNNISVLGAGRGNTILLRTSPMAGNTITFSGSNSRLASFTLNGNNLVNTSNLNGAEISISGKNVFVEDVEGTAWTTFFFTVTGSAMISNCQLHDATNPLGPGTNPNGASAFWTGGSSVTTVMGCRTYNLWGGAGFFQGYTTYARNYVKNTTQLLPGGQISSGPGAVITRFIDNTIKKDAGNGSGIEADFGKNIVVGNRIDSQAGYGIIVEYSSPNDAGPTVVSNNVVSSGKFAGIQLAPVSNAGGRYAVVSDNIVANNTSYGIYVNKQMDYYSVTGNVIFGSRANLTDIGSGTHKVVANNTFTQLH
jgi:Periplasmic copper-binding protein (NosD)